MRGLSIEINKAGMREKRSHVGLSQPNQNIINIIVMICNHDIYIQSRGITFVIISCISFLCNFFLFLLKQDYKCNWHNNKNTDGLVNMLASNLVILNQAHRVVWLIEHNFFKK